MYFYSAVRQPNGFNELHGVFLWAGLPDFMRLRVPVDIFWLNWLTACRQNSG